MNDNIVELLNEISKIPEISLLERIISYCEENDLDPKEIGDVLSESETFKTNLWLDCVENNSISDPLLKAKWDKTNNLDEW